MERIATLERRQAGYDEDVAAWADAQAELLRAGRFDAIDLENVIEEIESLGKSQRSALVSQIRRVIEHLLKLAYSPATDPRRGWVESIQQARSEIEDILSDSPSLRRSVEGVVERETQREIVGAARVLKSYDDLGADAERALLNHRFTVEQVIGDWFPSEAGIKL